MAMTLPPSIKKVGYDLYNYTLSHWASQEYIVWPPVQSQEELDDRLGRLRFYFNEHERIVVPRTSKTIKPRNQVPPYMGISPKRARFRFPVMKEKTSLMQLALSYKGVLLSKSTRHPKLDDFLRYLPNVAPFGPMIINSEAFWVMKLFFGPDQRRRSAQTQKRFQRWRANLPRKENAYLLCTGPSLQEFRNFDFSDGYVIGCNTVVKNDELMEHTKPIAVTATDPNFFFGPSIYSHQYREDLRKALNAYPEMAFFTADIYHQLLLNHLGEFNERTYILPFDYDGIVPDLDHEWAITRAPNILTGMMLALGSTLADNVYIIGADGRAPGDDYFWKHDPSSQLTDKLQAMKECHPTFFHETTYADYYDDHCEVLASQVAYLENKGKRVQSLTPSHIPVLKERLAQRS